MAKKKPKGASDAALHAARKAAFVLRRAESGKFTTDSDVASRASMILRDKRVEGKKSMAGAALVQRKKYKRVTNVNDVLPPPKRPGKK